jgi:hypothetical protein
MLIHVRVLHLLNVRNYLLELIWVLMVKCTKYWITVIIWMRTLENGLVQVLKSLKPDKIQRSSECLAPETKLWTNTYLELKYSQFWFTNMCSKVVWSVFLDMAWMPYQNGLVFVQLGHQLVEPFYLVRTMTSIWIKGL